MLPAFPFIPMRSAIAIVLIVCAVSVTACATKPGIPELSVTSVSFADGGAIPTEYTCDGRGVPPSLRMDRVPQDTKSLAILMDDLDAEKGIAVHWMVWNVDPKNADIGGMTAGTGSVMGMNYANQAGYAAPCPPEGETHRYVWSVYASDRVLGISQNATRAQFKNALSGHVLAKGQLTGTYSR